ncbi:hypothetical protein ACXC9Q_23470 (plasmid) [Kribbella sp. CWNU-51]
MIQRPTGELALFDWAFTGDGALGEDVGNHIPDAVFDLFWPAERLPELAETCIANYLDTWLLPGLLGRASGSSHKAYHQQTDGRHLFPNAVRP